MSFRQCCVMGAAGLLRFTHPHRSGISDSFLRRWPYWTVKVIAPTVALIVPDVPVTVIV